MLMILMFCFWVVKLKCLTSARTSLKVHSVLRKILATESLLKMMKNAWKLFNHVEKRLDYKDKANLKVHVVKTWEATIAIHILHSNWRSKCIQAMKLGQLIEHNMKNIFLEKSCTKYGGNYSQILSLKIKIEHISGSMV